jgi:hypothetical protein
LRFEIHAFDRVKSHFTSDHKKLPLLTMQRPQFTFFVTHSQCRGHGSRVKMFSAMFNDLTRERGPTSGFSQSRHPPSHLAFRDQRHLLSHPRTSCPSAVRRRPSRHQAAGDCRMWHAKRRCRNSDSAVCLINNILKLKAVCSVSALLWNRGNIFGEN